MVHWPIHLAAIKFHTSDQAILSNPPNAPEAFETLGRLKAEGKIRQIGVSNFGRQPLDEALSRVVIDFSGRPGLEYHANYPRAMIGEFDVDLLHEFFQGFVNHAKVTLHIDNLRGANAHHIAETIFKAFGRALRVAVEADPRMQDIIPSTKGSL